MITILHLLVVVVCVVVVVELSDEEEELDKADDNLEELDVEGLELSNITNPLGVELQPVKGLELDEGLLLLGLLMLELLKIIKIISIFKNNFKNRID